MTGLAQSRGEVKLEFDRAYARVLEQTGGRAGVIRRARGSQVRAVVL